MTARKFIRGRVFVFSNELSLYFNIRSYLQNSPELLTSTVMVVGTRKRSAAPPQPTPSVKTDKREKEGFSSKEEINDGQPPKKIPRETAESKNY